MNCAWICEGYLGLNPGMVYQWARSPVVSTFILRQSFPELSLWDSNLCSFCLSLPQYWDNKLEPPPLFIVFVLCCFCVRVLPTLKISWKVFLLYQFSRKILTFIYCLAVSNFLLLRKLLCTAVFLVVKFWFVLIVTRWCSFSTFI